MSRSSNHDAFRPVTEQAAMSSARTPLPGRARTPSQADSDPSVAQLRQAETQAKKEMRRTRSGSFKKMKSEFKIASGLVGLASEYMKDSKVKGKDDAQKDMLHELLDNAKPVLEGLLNDKKPSKSRVVTRVADQDEDDKDDERTPTADPTTPTFQQRIRKTVSQSEERLSRLDKHQIERAAGATGIALASTGAGIFAISSAVKAYRSRSRSRSKSNARSDPDNRRPSSRASSGAWSSASTRSSQPVRPPPSPRKEAVRPIEAVPRSLSAVLPASTSLRSLQHRKIQHASAAILYREPLFERAIGSYHRMISMLEYQRHPGQPQRLFGVPLKQLTKHEGIETRDTLSGHPVRVPIFLHNLIQAFKRADCTVSGIFRKSPSMARLDEISRALDSDERGVQVDLGKLDPIMLGALLKRFLAHLPDPVLTGLLFKMFIMATHIKEPHIRKRMMHLTICMLPKVNRDVFEVLFVFLDWLSTYAHVDIKAGNQMDLSNIARVMAPTLLRPNHRDPRPVEVKSMVKAVLCLLEDQHILNEIPYEVAGALHIRAETDEPSESFLRKVEHVLHLR